MSGIERLPVDQLSARGMAAHFAGLHKVTGIVEAAALGLPTLKGLVVDASQVGATELLASASEIAPDLYLIRHDKRGERFVNIQGGYLVPRASLVSEASWYAALGRVTIILEPADPLDNLYSGCLLVTRDGRVRMEIVGPGFDASDINRGNITPMECHEYTFGRGKELKWLSSSYVDKESYTLSKSLRVRKIALKFAQSRRSFDIDEIGDGEAKRIVRSEYFNKPQVRSLFKDDEYTPAPLRFVESLAGAADGLRQLREGSNLSIATISASEIRNGSRLVFWDVVSFA